MDITVTWLPDLYGYRLDATGATGTVHWYRSVYWPDGRYTNTPLGTGVQLHDLSVPLDGATITYTGLDGVGTDDIPVTPPVANKPVLGVVDRPDVAAVPVVVESAREQTVSGRPVFYDVIGRNEPYVEPMPPIERSGTFTLLVGHTGGAFPNQTINGLRTVLKTGGRLMLRSPCAASGRVEDVVFVMLRWSESQVGDGNHHGPERRISIDWRAVDPLWGAEIMTGRIWGMVPVEFPTWGDVAAGVPTWGDLVDGGP